MTGKRIPLRGGGISVRVGRGPEIESRHTALGVVVGLSAGEEVQFGEPETLAFWRSAMKPFQALPLVEDGVAGRYGFAGRELAICCASHQGTRMHVDCVTGMLDRIGMDESALACGPHAPFHEPAHQALVRQGLEPRPLHNNCSGKHTSMLAQAAHHGWPTQGYEDRDHPLQARIRAELRRWLDVDPEELTWSVDGCGVPTPFLSLRQMARAYARLVRSKDSAPLAVVEAMTEHPEYVSGSAELSTELMRVTDGALLAKEGAEGVFCFAGVRDGWGAAVKVTDGSKRAVAPAVLELLANLRLIDLDALERLADLREPGLRNTQGRVVGRITAESVAGQAPVAGDI
jgi:L-asparaginase II